MRSVMRHVTLRIVRAAVVLFAVVLLTAMDGRHPAQAAGALASGLCGTSATKVDLPDVESARRDALAACNAAGAKECRALATIRKGCLALSINVDRLCAEVGYAGVGSTLIEAANSAIARCLSNGGQRCWLRQLACDTGG